MFNRIEELQRIEQQVGIKKLADEVFQEVVRLGTPPNFFYQTIIWRRYSIYQLEDKIIEIYEKTEWRKLRSIFQNKEKVRIIFQGWIRIWEVN